MGRGRERSERCAKCGRQTRSDKMVCIEKPILQNPVERKDIQDDQYFSTLTKKVCYCPSCGKHLRIYDKKIKENIKRQEREQYGNYSSFGGKTGGSSYNRGSGQQGGPAQGQYQPPKY